MGHNLSNYCNKVTDIVQHIVNLRITGPAVSTKRCAKTQPGNRILEDPPIPVTKSAVSGCSNDQKTHSNTMIGATN